MRDNINDYEKALGFQSEPEAEYSMQDAWLPKAKKQRAPKTKVDERCKT